MANSLLWIEKICYFQNRYGEQLSFFIVFRRSSQGTCCTFPLQFCGYMSRDMDLGPDPLACMPQLKLSKLQHTPDLGIKNVF